MLLPPNDFWPKFKETPGALSCCEAIAIYNIVQNISRGTYAELGSHKGKSGMAAAAGLKPGTFYLVDLIFDDEKIALDVAKRVYHAGSGIETEPVCMYSTEFIQTKDNYSYVFVDTGDHSEQLVMSEVKLLEDRMVKGGIIAFHDYGNQFTGVAKAYDYLVSTGKYEVIPIDWNEIFDYVRSINLEEGNNSWHEKGSEEYPKFVGALKRK